MLTFRQTGNGVLKAFEPVWGDIPLDERTAAFGEVYDWCLERFGSPRLIDQGISDRDLEDDDILYFLQYDCDALYFKRDEEAFDFKLRWHK